jgi:hypothetical protein
VFQCYIVWSFIVCFKVKRSDIFTIKNIVLIHIYHWEDTIPQEDTISRRIQSQGIYNLKEDTIPRGSNLRKDTIPRQKYYQDNTISRRIQSQGGYNPKEDTIPRQIYYQDNTISRRIQSQGGYNLKADIYPGGYNPLGAYNPL